jgi:hypothetical protein
MHNDKLILSHINNIQKKHSDEKYELEKHHAIQNILYAIQVRETQELLHRTIETLQQEKLLHGRSREIKSTSSSRISRLSKLR